ncbi:hypothetical protein PLICRDRAFT_56927 [Plicaturopsis crispa FD-325 SS-3]|nr:hypothetical protein PLICRDRAFT_56927 [Plicaturopsis crispa FD-325 SS-3]
MTAASSIPFQTTYYAVWPDSIKAPSNPLTPPPPLDTRNAPELQVYSADMRFDAPPDIIHLACILTPVSHPKRARSPIPDREAFYKKARIALEAPSKYSTLFNVSARQEDHEQRVWNDRPECEDRLAPIALLYEGFGRFLDVIDGRDEDWAGVSRARLESSVTSFCKAMRRHYADDINRRVSIQPLLENALQLYFPNCFHTSEFGNAGTATCCIESSSLPTIVAVFKNELFSRGTLPEEEALACMLHSYRRALETQGNELHKLHSLRTAALGITIMGPHIAFYAFALLDRPRIVQLTPILPTCTEDTFGRAPLLAAFRAAIVLHRVITRDRDVAMSRTESAPPESLSLPYVSSAPAFPDGASKVEFTLEKLIPTLTVGQHVYLAHTTAPDHTRVVVKFTRTYCAALHAFCADRGHAPRLLALGAVPGGWTVVVMAHVDDLRLPIDKLQMRELAPVWRKDLSAVVRAFHAEGWVHGDLRLANVLVDRAEPARALLIDFDWAGEEGRAMYPTTRLTHALMEGRDPDDLVIRKADDERVLKASLEMLSDPLADRPL